MPKSRTFFSISVKLIYVNSASYFSSDVKKALACSVVRILQETCILYAWSSFMYNQIFFC